MTLESQGEKFIMSQWLMRPYVPLSAAHDEATQPVFDLLYFTSCIMKPHHLNLNI